MNVAALFAATAAFGERKKCKGGAALKRGKKSLPIALYARFGRPAEGRELI